VIFKSFKLFIKTASNQVLDSS